MMTDNTTTGADDAGVAAVAGVIEASLARHGVDLADCEGTLDDARAAIAALARLPTTDVEAENRKLTAALRDAENALRDHACHSGDKVPCRRDPSQCAAECGKSAGDALIVVLAALGISA